MKKTLKNLFVILCFISVCTLTAENKGNFLRINNTSGVRGVRALASHIVAHRTTFRYTPGTQKMGVLDDLTLTGYAISPDRSTMALTESQPQDDGKFLNRIVFFEFGGFRIINGMEYTADYKIEKSFFFMGNLYCITKGNEVRLRQLILTRNLKFDPKSVVLEEDVTSIACDRSFIYLKGSGRMMWQFTEKLKKISTMQTRHDGGFLLIRDVRNDQIINFTKENIETIQRTPQGIFKSSFRDLKDIPQPDNAWLSPIKNSIYFSTADGELYELINMSICEKSEIPEFQQILYHPYKREFYVLAKKKHEVFIIRLNDFSTRKKMVPHSMRPATHRNLKFMIPHPSGLFIITQQGEFAIIREYRRRFRKTKFQ